VLVLQEEVVAWKYLGGLQGRVLSGALEVAWHAGSPSGDDRWVESLALLG